MGFLDDAASLVSGRSSHSKHHHRSKSSSHHHKSSRDKSRSRSRSRTRAAPSIVGSVFGLGSEAGHSSHGHSHSHSHHRSDKEKRRHSGAGSFFGGGGAGSIFGGGGHEERHHHHSSKHEERKKGFFGLGNASRGSFFGFGSGRSPSYYKRQPRTSFMQKVWHKLKRLIRDLMYYAKRHPWRVFMLVVVPLVTTGALTALLSRFGLRLPQGLERMVGVAAKASTGDGFGLVGEAMKMASGGLGGGASRAQDSGLAYPSPSAGDGFGGGSGGGWTDGLMGNVGKGLMGGMGGGLMSSVGKMFI